MSLRKYLISFVACTFSVAVVYDVLTAGVKYIGWVGWLSVLVVGSGLVASGIYGIQYYNRTKRNVVVGV